MASPHSARRRGLTTSVLAGAIVAWGAVGAAAAPPAKDPAACRRRCTDVTAPTVRVDAPSSGSTVAGVVVVRGVAGDATGVVDVSLRIDAGPWSSALGTSAWSRAMDTVALADGPHTVAVRASDAAGNVATVTVPVAVANAVPDTNPPAVSIVTPADGAAVPGSMTVSGTASDGVAVAAVTVSVDGEPPRPAAGTAAWSVAPGPTPLSPGPHTVVARATDTSGNAATATVTVTVPQAPAGDVVVSDPAATHGLELLGRTRLPVWGPVTGVVASESFTSRKVVWFRDATSGATSVVELTGATAQGWSDLAAVMTSASDLWLLGGSGPLVARHFRLAGGPLPTSATLVDATTFGDTDSRQGDLLGLAGGGVVAAWHQQGAIGAPQGQFAAYRGPDQGPWQQLPRIAFMPSESSDQVLGQHPADGSVWLFSNPDAWGNIGAAHFSVVGGALVLDWTDASFISDEEYGLYGPDPENPFLAAAADPSTGTLALAYQSADRRWFGAGPYLVGSRVAVARIAADGTPAFVAAPVWAERVAAVGLVVGPGETVVSYRPVDEATMSYDGVAVSRLGPGGWEPPVSVGTLAVGSWTIGYGTARAELAARLADGRIHLRAV